MAETVGQHSVAAFTSPVNGTSPIDANTVKGNDNTIRSAYVDHDADPGIHVQSSTLASRPVANSAGRKWMTQDSGVIRLFYDDGTSWYEIDYLRTTGGTISGNLAITGTLSVTGVATLTAQPILSSLTASQAVFTDASKGLVSNAITGTGNVVMSASPTLTGTITAAAATLSGALGVSGLLTFASLKGTGTTTVTNILDEDNMASDSATALATQQSIKAYVDAQVGASDALSEVLAIGNTTGANDIIVSAGQKIRTPAVAAQDGSSAITIANTTGALTLATALADSNLATISTAGKVSNSATTATNANTASAIVARDSSGNFSAGTITAALSGNASTATALQTARTINGVSFDGTANITVTAAAGTLTGSTLASGVTASSLTSVGTLANLTVTNPISGSVTGSSGSTTGNAATATALQTARTINGTSFDGTANITVTAAAGTLTGSTLASGVTASSLTSVGTLSSLTVSGAITGATSTNTINGLIISSGGLGGSTGIKFGIGTAFSSGQAEAYTTSTTPMGIGTVGAQPLRFYANSALVGAFDSSGNLAVDTNTLYVDAANNRVGIGLTNPSETLDVKGTGNFNAVGGTYLGFQHNATQVGYVGTANAIITGGATTNFGIYAQSAMVFSSGGSTERMRLDASGRLGIGTASPADVLEVKFSTNGYITASNSSDTNTGIKLGNTGRTYGIFADGGSGASNALRFYDFTAGAERMRLDASGNLGLGVTPSAWGANRTTVQIHGTTQPNILFTGNPTNGGAIWTNAYYDGTNAKYVATGAASIFSSSGGAFQWYTAASGTAGNNVTFTQAMTLDASGNLGVGATTVSSTLGRNVTINGTNAGTNSGIVLQSAATERGYVYASDAQMVLGSSTSIPLLMLTAGTERARITSGGYFKASNDGTYVGSTASHHELRVTGAAGDWNTIVANATATGANAYGVRIAYTGSAPNNTGNPFLNCDDTGATRAVIRSNGGLANYQSNNVDLSDARTKTDITPAASMWDKVAALEIVTYKYNDQTHDDVNLGVIAQQVETVEPVWVDADGFGETPEGEEPLKTVYTKDITFAAIKALQEAMARIEALEARLATLEN